jgi:hypothetical protein
MIARLLRSSLSLLVYFCLATFIAQIILLAYFGLAWKVNRGRLVQALAVLQGVDLLALRGEPEDDLADVGSEQVSYEQVLETRASQVAHLQLREQALKDGLDQLRFEQNKLATARQEFQQLKQSLDAQLLAMQENATSQGMTDVRSKLEAIKSKQAKELLLEMLNSGETNAVVTLLSGMPTTKSAKIISEFKTDEEMEQIAKVLRLIREGSPASELAAGTKEKLNQLNQTTP